MGKLAPLIAAAVLAFTAPAIASDPPDREAELARALEGRIAGEPVNCIDLYRVRSSRIINDTAIIYDAGGTLYVNRPRTGADSLNQWDTLVTRTFSTRLCNTDTVHLVDQQSGMLTGIIFLDDFVPYRREQSASAR
jgi:hypothetical protein